MKKSEIEKGNVCVCAGVRAYSMSLKAACTIEHQQKQLYLTSMTMTVYNPSRRTSVLTWGGWESRFHSACVDVCGGDTMHN